MEDFTKTLNNLGQDAIKSAKKLKNIAMLNIDIASEEDKRKNSYTALGKLYYETHAACPDGALAAVCEQIKKSDERIAELKSKLSKVKGMERCDGCGAEIKSDAIFCPYCGKETDFKAGNEPPKSETVCPKCGEKMSDDMSYCPKCGEKLQ